jgi:hypothetical protein
MSRSATPAAGGESMNRIAAFAASTLIKESGTRFD